MLLSKKDWPRWLSHLSKWIRKLSNIMFEEDLPQMMKKMIKPRRNLRKLRLKLRKLGKLQWTQLQKVRNLARKRHQQPQFRIHILMQQVLGLRINLKPPKNYKISARNKKNLISHQRKLNLQWLQSKLLLKNLKTDLFTLKNKANKFLRKKKQFSIKKLLKKFNLRKSPLNKFLKKNPRKPPRKMLLKNLRLKRNLLNKKLKNQ